MLAQKLDRDLSGDPAETSATEDREPGIVRWRIPGIDERDCLMVTVASREEAMEGGAQLDHLFQARLPLRIYDWLRTRWYEQRVSMNSVVIDAVVALRNGQVGLPARAQADSSEEDDTSQRFTVRMPAVHYEWLRAEAFRRQVSINKLLMIALERQLSPATASSAGGHRHLRAHLFEGREAAALVALDMERNDR
jgi:predicted HicB family RNase H-like nuclease